MTTRILETAGAHQSNLVLVEHDLLTNNEVLILLREITTPIGLLSLFLSVKDETDINGSTTTAKRLSEINGNYFKLEDDQTFILNPTEMINIGVSDDERMHYFRIFNISSQ